MVLYAASLSMVSALLLAAVFVFAAAAAAAAARAETVAAATATASSNTKRASGTTSTDNTSTSNSRPAAPNFVIVLTDDLDWTLGGANASTLEKTRRLVGGEGNGDNNGNNNNNNSNNGTTLSNWFVQTPVCCASRAELLTGKMYHNLKVAETARTTADVTTTAPTTANKDQGCMHVDVEDDPDHPFWDRDYFSNFFADADASSGDASSDASSGDASSDASSDDNTNNNTENNDSKQHRAASNTKPKPKPKLNLNYSIGIFGKLLNHNNPTNFLPNGVDEMLINNGGEYLNPTFTHGIRRPRKASSIEHVTFDNCTESTGMPCYSTAVIGNASLSWIERQVIGNSNNNNNNNNNDHQETTTTTTTSSNDHKQHKPFFAFISVKAPHIQDGEGFPMATPAPWYQNVTIPETRAPRTPNYNTTSRTSTDENGQNTQKRQHQHHWLVRNQQPLTELEAAKVDDLYVSRLKTLLSVDDLVQDLVQTLERLRVLENTYVLFTSDNGYRLGQFRMPQCKLHPYENDVRVPMMIRGPGIGNGDGSSRGSISISGKGNENENENSNGFYSAKNNDKHDNDNNHPHRRRHRRRTAALFSHVHLMPTLLGLATGQHDSQDIVPQTMDGTNLASWILLSDADHDHHHHYRGGLEVRERETIDRNRNHNHGRSNIEGSRHHKASPYATTISRATSVNTTTTTASSFSLFSSFGSPSQQATTSTSLLIEYTSLGNVVRYHHLVDTYNHSFVALRIMPGKPGRVTSIDNSNNRTRIPRGRVGATAKSNRKNWHVLSSSSPIEHISNLKYIEFRDSRIDWTNTKTSPLERELYDLDSDPFELDNLIEEASAVFLKALEDKTKRLIECSGDNCRMEHSTGLELLDHNGANEF